jgi:hypothetical protein
MFRERKNNVTKVGRILLGDNTGDGAANLLPIGFNCVGVWILPAVPSMFLPP